MKIQLDQRQAKIRRFRPHYPRFELIPHYYGDMVRALLLGGAILILGGAPFYTDSINDKLPYLIIGAVAAVALAALTNPRSSLIMGLNATLAGIGAIVYEFWALWYYQIDSVIDFVLRQSIAILCMFAFYFALKTLRAMLMGNVGKEADLSEFEEEQTQAQQEMEEIDDSISEVEDGLGHTPVQEDSGSD